MSLENEDVFPLSKTKSIKGSRRLAREKVLQVITAYEVSEIPWTKVFSHIFFRKFNFGDTEEKLEKLLTPDEIYELESDIPITWDDDDIIFARKLIENTIVSTELTNEMINEFAKNWELERFALIDRILINMAITEIKVCEDIPTKVTINEAIEIAKKYSTEKSGTFINGLLEAMIEKLNLEKQINKTGKGLIDK